jgi:sucrose-phosphate synthase
MLDPGLFVLLVSVHGLIRGRSPELGRDADTGGQVVYVLELAKALGQNPAVARVDLLTRAVSDPAVSPEYAIPEEWLGPGARIIRIPFGPKRYIRKELLWDHLDHLVDGYLSHARGEPRLPDIIHGHYGDAGYVAMRLSGLLGIPYIHTGHSLGRYKKSTLLRAGRKEAQLERQFNFEKRISVEEEVLAHASRVIVSTGQEATDQYALYTNFDRRRTVINPPGTDMSRFGPPRRGEALPPVAGKVDRFLEDPEKPMLLWIGRPVPRKNLAGLLRAFGEDPELRERANLVLIGGNRADIRDLEEVSRTTWEEVLLAVDRYDLYGHVAMPKTHEAKDVPELYRLAVLRRGICVNPAHSETFGLTLIEAAASGLPLVATSSGGPRDIVANCRNGLLVDPGDTRALAAAMKEAVSDPRRWREWSRSGLRRVRQFYTWEAHVERFLKMTRPILRREQRRARKERVLGLRRAAAPTFLSAEWVLVFDLDRTLVGDRPALERLMAWVGRHRGRSAFGVVTGRRLESALPVLRSWGIGSPDVLISSVGSEIHYGPDWQGDAGFEHHIRPHWRRSDVARVLAGCPGLRLQAERKQGAYKLSYHLNPAKAPGPGALYARLHGAGLRARLVFSQARFLDVLPHRASKGQAVRYLSFKWAIPLTRFVVAGDSGSDLDMLTGETRGIVVANHSPEIAFLQSREGIYFAERPFAGGVLEGLEHYGLLEDETPAPEESPDYRPEQAS